jgi:predicted DNA-binding transcriptional regulator AlpA
MQINGITDPLADPAFLDRLINETQAAEMFGYSVSALQNWRVRGNGPRFVKPSKRNIRYRIRDLIAWVDKNTAAHTSQYEG